MYCIESVPKFLNIDLNNNSLYKSIVLIPQKLKTTFDVFINTMRDRASVCEISPWLSKRNTISALYHLDLSKKLKGFRMQTLIVEQV